MNQDIIYEDLQEIYDRDVEWSKLKNKTILLTGAYGMLASYVTYMIMYLNEKYKMNIEIIAVVKNQEKFYKRFPEAKTSVFVKVVESDLIKQINISGGVDYIIHAASLASPQYYSVCPVEVLTPNVIGTYNLLQLAREKDVNGFLLFSTGDIYGKVDGKEFVTETDYGIMDPLDIHNCYSESKRMAETMCYCYYKQYGIKTKIARIWHTYAPTMDIENDPRVFSSFVKNIVKCEDIVMKSDGSGRRSFCYITDAVAGYFKILLEGKDGEAYNVCNQDAYVSISELADTLVNLFPEKNLKVIRKERDASDKYVENVLLKNSVSIPSNEKLKLLGWKNKVGIQEGFYRVIKFHEKNNNII